MLVFRRWPLRAGGCFVGLRLCREMGMESFMEMGMETPDLKCGCQRARLLLQIEQEEASAVSCAWRRREIAIVDAAELTVTQRRGTIARGAANELSKPCCRISTRGLGEVILQADAFILIANASAMRLNDTSSMLASLGLAINFS